MIPAEIDFYIKSGFSLIPIQYQDKRPNGRMLKQIAGSASWKLYTLKQPNNISLKHWFDDRKINVGVVTGFDNLAVLDFDNMAQYAQWIKFMFKNKRAELNQIFDRSLFVNTSRGRHIYIKLEQNKSRKFNKLDLKGKWGYVLAPPSIHPTGFRYNFFHFRSEILDLPMFEKIEDIIPPEWVEAEHTRTTTPMRAKKSLWERANTISQHVGDVDYEKIKSEIRIEDLLPPGSPLRKSGSYIITLCPFHDDKNPSFWINTELNICGCHGGCFDHYQTVIGFYSKLKNISINEAIIELSNIMKGTE